MKQGDIYKSEGGYRVAWAMWGDGPVITNDWYATKEAAETAKELRRLNNLEAEEIDEFISKCSSDGLEDGIEKIRQKYAALKK